MYALYFYLCLLTSVALVVGLVLLAIFPIHLPVVQTEQIIYRPPTRKSRSPTRRQHLVREEWDGDEDDL